MTPSTNRLTQARATLAPVASVASGFFTISEAAAKTHTGQETIRRAIRAGKIPACGMRGRLRIRLGDVLSPYVPQRKGVQE
jgi:excisionase family DNA binding protein